MNVALSVQSTGKGLGHLYSPDGRQTRIDFFSSGNAGKKVSHVIHSKKASHDWWQTFTGWLKSTQQEQNQHKPEEFVQFLKSRQYSNKTCNSYLFMLRKFFSYLDQYKISEITPGIIEDYNYDFFVSGRYSRSYQLQFINGLTLYLEFFQGKKVNLKGLRRSEMKR